MVSIEVDSQKCSGCEDCIVACPASVFEMRNGKAEPVNVEDCIECCACVDVCEPKAIIHDAC